MEADAEHFAQSRSRSLNWSFAIFIIVLHAAAIAALFYFTWSALVVFFAMWMLSANVGIAITYHRLLTHRGFIVPKWLEYTMTICSTMALQGGPIFWVACHRLHHQLSDRPGDPHSPRDGKWWSHMGWILYGTIHNGDPQLARYAPDLMRDRVHVWLSKYHLLPITLVSIGLYYFGGLPWLLWGTAMRAVVGLHTTWAVNSVTHVWGSRRFDTRDDSTNNWWVALLTGGEGWHNNHHANPVSATHGMAWYEIDVNFWIIRVLGFMGLAKKIKVQGVKPGPARILHG
jgi:fatty-acid desaturase